MCGCGSPTSTTCGCPDAMIADMFRPSSTGPTRAAVRAGGANCPPWFRGVQGLVATPDGRLLPWASAYQQIEVAVSPILAMVNVGLIPTGIGSAAVLGAGSVALDLIATCDPGQALSRSGGRLADALRMQAAIVGAAGAIAVFVAPPAAPICGAVAGLQLVLAEVVSALSRGESPSLGALVAAIGPITTLLETGGVDLSELRRLAERDDVKAAAASAKAGGSADAASSGPELGQLPTGWVGGQPTFVWQAGGDLPADPSSSSGQSVSRVSNSTESGKGALMRAYSHAYQAALETFAQQPSVDLRAWMKEQIPTDVRLMELKLSAADTADEIKIRRAQQVLGIWLEAVNRDPQGLWALSTARRVVRSSDRQNNLPVLAPGQPSTSSGGGGGLAFLAAVVGAKLAGWW